MKCKPNKGLTNGVTMMIRQGAISVKVEETDSAVTNFPGVVPLANLGERLGLFADLDALPPAKERRRGFSKSAAVFDLMSIPLSPGIVLRFPMADPLRRAEGPRNGPAHGATDRHDDGDVGL